MSAVNDMNATTDYNSFRAMIQKKLKEEKRYVTFDERKDDGVMSTEMFKVLHHGKYWTYWKGVELMKNALDIVIYQQLLWDVKPRTVFEMGSYAGGSALWMADTLKSFGCDSHIFSLDINLSNVHSEAKACKEITFIEGDAKHMEKSFAEDQLQVLPHPWLLVEDAHVNLVGVLKFFDRFLLPGDYVVVEDTSPKTVEISGQGLIEELGYVESGPANYKLPDLKAFMKDHSDRYVVDQHYADFFGYNATGNYNGFLKRI